MKQMDFEPDYRNIEDAARNRRPRRLPLYEHGINTKVLSAAAEQSMDGLGDGPAGLRRWFEVFCHGHRKLTYDTVSFEYGVTGVLPGGGALKGERAGVIQTRELTSTNTRGTTSRGFSGPRPVRISTTRPPRCPPA